MSYLQPLDSGTPSSGGSVLWTPGSTLTQYREIVYGAYIFPLTFQVTDNDSKLAIDKRKISRVMGDFQAYPKSVLSGRQLSVLGDVGSGMVGSAGNMLQTPTDLENERALLAGLQNLGKQKLWTRWDRYINAELEEFSFKFFQDGGSYRYATEDLKFYASDPRYYSATVHSTNMGPFTDASAHAINPISHLGNCRAYPTIIITGACVSPTISIYQGGSNLISVTFSTLTMGAGDVLTIATDPRPEYRNQPVIYVPYGGAAINGLIYCIPSTDLANSIDSSEFFPYIEQASQTIGTQQFVIQAQSGTNNYSVALTYQDTWL
jgi:hypothetical protein